ncbi:MAG: LytR C-terminal domain-containing protein, partial [Fidelibacterota bacterium]
MTTFRRRPRTTSKRNNPARTHRTWRKRKRDFQHWLFNLTLAVMGLLVLGFIISALTTRSGIEVTLTTEDLADRARLLTMSSGTISEDIDLADNQTEIEILNGCGIPGVASKFTDYLRRKGYDVVRFT